MDVYTADVVSVGPDASLGKTLSTLRTNRIGHLPVVDGDDVVGVVSLSDVIEFVTRELQRAQGGDPEDASTDAPHGGFGAREDERTTLLDLPVRNVMVETLGTTTTDETLDAALDTMVELDASSAIVLNNGSLEWIVTKTVLIESLTWTDEGRLPVQVFGVELMEESTREELGERIQRIARKYCDMRVLEAKVHFHEHDETFRDVSLLLARVRLYNGQGDVRGFGRGLRRSSRRSLALNAIGRQILEGKTHGRSKKPADADEIAKMYGWWLSE